jgi:hypothetical protein
MQQHPFLFTPGEWIGQGTLILSISPTPLIFYTKWMITAPIEGVIHCVQQVETQGVEGIISSHVRLFDIEERGFSLTFENSTVGLIKGEGKITEETLYWAYREKVPFEGTEGFTGYEQYTWQDPENYTFLAEYVNDEECRTAIQGKIWKKNG